MNQENKYASTLHTREIFKKVETTTNFMISPDHNCFAINIEKLIEGQMPINRHFPNPNRDKPYVNVFDSMVGQISEERFEILEAFYNNDFLESIKETIDMTMYIGSLICETMIYYHINPADFFAKYPECKEVVFSFNASYMLKEEGFIEYNGTIVPKVKCLPSIDNLEFIRRQIYDRKYHKPHGEVEHPYYEENLIKLIIFTSFGSHFDDEFKDYPRFLGLFSEWLIYILETMTNVNELNEIISLKQDYITNL